MLVVSEESSELSDRLVLFVSEVPSDTEELSLSVVSVVFDASERAANEAVRVVSSSEVSVSEEKEVPVPVVFVSVVVEFDPDDVSEEDPDDGELETVSDEDVSVDPISVKSDVVESEEVDDDVFVVEVEPVVVGVEELPDEVVSVADEPISVAPEVLSDEVVSVIVESEDEVPEVPDEVVSVADDPNVDVSADPVSTVGDPENDESEEEEVSPEDALTVVSVEFPSAHTPGVATTRMMTRMKSKPKTFITQHPSPQVS